MKQLTKERPIIFTGDSVKKILAGRKTMTRRIVKPQPVGPCECGPGGEWWDAGTGDTLGNKYQVGMRLWVREAFRFYYDQDLYDCIEYRNDRAKLKPSGLGDTGFQFSEKCGIDSPWQSPLFMPRWASRITLEITDVFVQRVQKISEEDAQAEGCDGNCGVGNVGAYLKGKHSYHFATLWDAINGDGSWDSNPFCWAFTFRKV